MIRSLMLLVTCLAVVFTVYAQDPTADEPILLFDDFDYTAYDDVSFIEHGWIVREGGGWPGVPDAVWRAENVSFISDPDNEANTLLQMASTTDSTDTYQTQICHARKYYEGTYAARVRFSNAPDAGRDGDQVVQTFYLISPQEYDMAPDYSELDFEYLPNGGWGAGLQTLFATTWETFQLEPWIADNESGISQADYSGWHVLVIHIAEGETCYYIDGELIANHSDEYYPEVPMSINFNLWFINGGLIHASTERTYIEQIDWVLFLQNEVVESDAILDWVDDLRADAVSFVDTVPAWEPELVSPCDF